MNQMQARLRSTHTSVFYILALVVATMSCSGCRSRHEFSAPETRLLLAGNGIERFKIVTINAKAVTVEAMDARVAADYCGMVEIDGEVFIQSSDGIARLDLATGQLTGLPLSFPSRPTGKPHQIAAAAGGIFVVGANGVLLRVDPRSNEVEAVPGLICDARSQIASDGRYVAVADGKSGVQVYDVLSATTQSYSIATKNACPGLFGMVSGVLWLDAASVPRVLMVNAGSNRAIYDTLTDYAKTLDGDTRLVSIANIPWTSGATVLPGYAREVFFEVGGSQVFAIPGVLDPDIVEIGSGEK